MSLSNAWLQTQGDGLVRADQVVGIDAHQTPALTGKPGRWLLDVVLATPVGSGQRGDWGIDALHRTLVQTSQPPEDAPAELARLLSQLDAINAAGIVTVVRHGQGGPRTGRRGAECGVLGGGDPVHRVRRTATGGRHRGRVPLVPRAASPPHISSRPQPAGRAGYPSFNRKIETYPLL